MLKINIESREVVDSKTMNLSHIVFIGAQCARGGGSRSDHILDKSGTIRFFMLL